MMCYTYLRNAYFIYFIFFIELKKNIRIQILCLVQIAHRLVKAKQTSKGEFTQYPFFVRFCTFFLDEKVCYFASAFLFADIRTNQTVTHWTKVLEDFFVMGYNSI